MKTHEATHHRRSPLVLETMEGMEYIPFSGENLKKKRESLKLSRREVSEGTNIAASLIQSYEENQKDPGRKKLATIGAYLSRVTGTRIKFVCDWDLDAVKDYAAFELTQEELDKIKAALRND